MVYKIEIIETLSKTVEIEAEDYTEAKMKWNGCITMKKWY